MTLKRLSLPERRRLLKINQTRIKWEALVNDPYSSFFPNFYHHIVEQYLVDINLFILTAVLNPFHFSQALSKQQRDRFIKGHRDRNEIRSRKWKVVHVGVLSEKTKHLNFHLGRKKPQPFPSIFFVHILATEVS